MAESSPDCDIFATLAPEMYPDLRRNIIQMILATDMQQHFLLLELFERETNNSGESLGDWGDRLLVMKMALHLADLSNPARPVHLAQRWGYNVVSEMFKQGDHERSLGMPCSPVCDREKVKVATAQMRFISYFFSPTAAAWARVCPRFGLVLRERAQLSLAAWAEVERETQKGTVPGNHGSGLSGSKTSRQSRTHQAASRAGRVAPAGSRPGDTSNGGGAGGGAGNSVAPLPPGDDSPHKVPSADKSKTEKTDHE